MSHKADTASEQEHGTTRSYVTGFVLSVVFTIIPYYLVVEKVVTGSTLVATIMGFAMLQMIVQIVFFLHLGREKKPRWQLLFFMSTIGIVVIVIGGSLWIMGHLHYNMTPVTPEGAATKLIEGEGIHQIGGEETGACHGQHKEHRITLRDGKISPGHIDAELCDRLIFINEDQDPRYIMFGSYEQPVAYAGEDMLTVRNGRHKMLVLNQTGTHFFHDHMNAEATGSFTVKPSKQPHH